MTGMWSRWARERRITGLIYLTGAAIALAVAVLLFTRGEEFWSGVFISLAGSFIAIAGVLFYIAHDLKRRVRNGAHG